MIFRKNSESDTARGSVKLASYTVFGVLATVLSSSVLPPLFTSSTARALINAPLLPLTTPINGVVRISDQMGRASVENDKVDNSTLIGLKVQLAALDNELRQKNSIIDDYAIRIRDLHNDLSSQQSALLSRTDADLKAAQTALEMVTYSARIAKSDATRKLRLMVKGAAAGNADEVADSIHLEDSKLEAAKLSVEKLSNEMNFARDGIYIGSDLQSLQNLQQEIRSRSADLLQIKMQMTTMQSRRSELETLVAKESARIDRLMHADLAIPPGTRLYKPIAATGRQVVAGDTLAEALDCHDAFVVAIFSERQAQALAVGSKVKVTADQWPEAVDGMVERLIPRTTDRVDLDYAVPFPPTERRELYAYIRLAPEGQTNLSANAICSVGTWVNVTMPQEWFEKTRGYALEASSKLAQFAMASADYLPEAKQAALEWFARSRDNVLTGFGYDTQTRQPPRDVANSLGKRQRRPEPKPTEGLAVASGGPRARSGV
ncbi:HlyD family efflux transporter periplasmic adaptor subunit [Rhizobium freirei]|nr:HlyD family secretion protein [Rhizobium freirei]